MPSSSKIGGGVQLDFVILEVNQRRPINTSSGRVAESWRRSTPDPRFDILVVGKLGRTLFVEEFVHCCMRDGATIIIDENGTTTTEKCKERE
jgi:hypothetical protein